MQEQDSKSFKGNFNMIDASPTHEKFMKHVYEVNSKLSEAKELDKININKSLHFLEAVSYKTKYQLKIVSQGLLFSLIFPFLEERNDMDKSEVCAKIFLNICQNKSNHYRLNPESEILNRVLNLLLENYNTPLTIYLLKILCSFTENKDFLNKLESQPSMIRSSSDNHNSKNSTEFSTDLFVNKLLCEVLDNIRSSNKHILLKTVHNIFCFHKKYVERDGIEPVVRALGDNKQDTIYYAMKLLEFYSKSAELHEQLMNCNLIIRLIRIQFTGEKGIPHKMSVITVKILLNLFENESLHTQLMTENMTEFLNMQFGTSEMEVNEEVMMNVFEIIKKISKRNSEFQEQVFNKAFEFAKNSKNDEFILSCFRMINLTLEPNNYEIINKKETTTDIQEFIPSFFKSSNKEILLSSLSIYNIFLEAKGEEIFNSISNDKQVTTKTMIKSIISIINHHFKNNNLVQKACTILVYLSKAEELHPNFLQEPEISIIRIFVEGLIDMNMEVQKEIEAINKKNEEHNELKSGNHFTEESHRSDSSQSEKSEKRRPVQIKTNVRGIKKNKTINFKQTKKKMLDKRKNSIKSTRKNLPEYDKSLMSNELEEKNKERVRELTAQMNSNTEVMRLVIQIITNLSKNADNLENMTNKGFLEVINQLLVEQNLSIFEHIIQCLEGFSVAKSSVKKMLYCKVPKKINDFIPRCDQHQKEVIFKSMKVILQDFNIQKEIILEKGITTFLNEITEKNDKLNYLILKAVHEVTSHFSNLCYSFFGKQSLVVSERRLNDKKSPISAPELFKDQFSQENFLAKVLVVGNQPNTSLKTYKEMLKIIINLYLNRFYVKNLTSDDIFDRVVSILEFILDKFRNKTRYIKVVNLILVLLKFVCEEEQLIKKFLNSSAVNKIIELFISEPEKVDISERSSYNFKLSFILMRLSNFKGHSEKFSEFENFSELVKSLYEHNDTNGKVYIINMIENLLNEKREFFDDAQLIEFKDMIVTNSNSLIIYEFVELLRILVQKKEVAKNMENVFKVLLVEINKDSYSKGFKEKMFYMILCISTECENIKGLPLKELLAQIKDQDIKIGGTQNLLLLVNFSIEIENFNYLKVGEDEHKKSENSISKAEIKAIINDYPNETKFKETLIQRLLINITSLENLDLSIISDRLIEQIIITLEDNLESGNDNAVIFALTVLVNLTNKNNSILLQDTKEDSVKQDVARDDPGYEVYTTERFGSRTSPETVNLHHHEHILNIVLKKLRGKFYNVFDKLNKVDNDDISAILILFYCNVSPRLSKENPEEDEKIAGFLSSYFLKHFKKENFDSLSGKFLFYSGMKFCIFTLLDQNNIEKYRKILSYIYRLLFEEKLLKGDLNKTDLKENSINFMLKEIHLKFMNILLSVQDSIKDKFPNAIESIKTFLLEFMGDFCELLEQDVEYKVNSNVQDLFLSLLYMVATFLKGEHIQYSEVQEHLRVIISRFIKYDPHLYSSELKSLFIYIVFIIINNKLEEDDAILTEDMKRWLVHLFELQSNTIQTDYYCLKLFSKTNNNFASQNEEDKQDLRKNHKFLRKLSHYLKKQVKDGEFSIKKETEKFLNILSFDEEFHPRLFELKIFDYFKTNFLTKLNTQSKKFHKHDVIFMVNFLKNKDNHSKIKKDLLAMLECVLRCKEISIPIKVQLFEMILNTTYENSHMGEESNSVLEKQYNEDIVTIFDLLYNILQDNFSDTIFLLETFLMKYDGIVAQLSRNEQRIKNVYNDLKRNDPCFPSLSDELASFIKILDKFIECNYSPTTKFITNDLIESLINNKDSTEDLNIVNTMVEFVFGFYKNNFSKENKLKQQAELLAFVKEYRISEMVDCVLEKAIETKNIVLVLIVNNQLLIEENYTILGPFFQLSSKIYSDELFDFILSDCSDIKKLSLKTLSLYIYLFLDMFQASQKEFDNGKLAKVMEIYYAKLKAFTRKEFEMEEDSSQFINCYLFLCDLIYSSKKDNDNVTLIIDTFMMLAKIKEISVTQKQVIFKTFQEILITLTVTKEDEFDSLMGINTLIKQENELSMLENLFVGTIVVCCNNDILQAKLKDIYYIIQGSIQTYETERMINCLRYIKQLYFSFLDKNKTNEMTILKKLLEDIEGMHSKEIDEDKVVQKKMVSLKKKLSTFV